MTLAAVLPMLLSQMIFRLPSLLVWVVAIVVAVQRWKQHPRVSLLVVIAMSALALEGVTSALVTTALPLLMARSGATAVSVSLFSTVYRMFANIVTAGCWGLMAVAVFGWRTSDLPHPLPDAAGRGV